MEHPTEKLSCESFYGALLRHGVDYFCGVPDSLLSSFGLYLQDKAPSKHDVAPNEGNAIGLAIGFYIATSKIPLVYMQNSGLGNATNPLVSLADPEVLGVPMILLVGWRGQPGTQDEPQHKKQGEITQELLRCLKLGFATLARNEQEVNDQVAQAVSESRRTKKPYVLLVEKDTFDTYIPKVKRQNAYTLTREEVIRQIAEAAGENVVIATAGKTGRELFEYREETHSGHQRDLLVVGGMGHTSSIALGVAQQQPSLKVFCIDGDGAVLMHMGALAEIGSKAPANLYHIVINNGSHESVGGQPTAGFDVDLTLIAKACGYRESYSVAELGQLKKSLNGINGGKGPIFIEVRVNNSARSNLSRPTLSPEENKKLLMSYLVERK